MNTTANTTTAAAAAAADIEYAIRKVSDLRAQAASMFDLPATQEALKDTLENQLAESIKLNQAPVLEAEAQKQRQVVRASQE